MQYEDLEKLAKEGKLFIGNYGGRYSAMTKEMRDTNFAWKIKKADYYSLKEFGAKIIIEV